MVHNVQVFRTSQLWRKVTTPALDILGELQINVSVPFIVEAASAQDDAVVLASWKYVGRVFKRTLR